MQIDKEKFQFLDSCPPDEKLHDLTFTGVFESNADSGPNKTLYYFLEDGISETSRITYNEMRGRAKAVATALQAICRKGDVALLLFPPGIEFAVGLFGCFYSGIIAVPAYPPRKNRLFSRFESIIRDCTPKVILTTRKIHDDIVKNFSGEECITGVRMLVYEEVEDSLGSGWKDPGITAGDIALLQYTSGSTGKPNGVVVSHRNIVHNSEFIKEAYGHDENLVGVNWLPGFHDMGLIGTLLQPAYTGGSNAIIPPSSFLLRPMNWLKSISKFRANTAGGPNFSLDYCVDHLRPEELGDADLSCVRPFFCGAEPVRKESLERFAAAFKPYNFKPEQFYPCYGLAETVLMATGGRLDEKPVYLYVKSEDIDHGNVTITSPGDPDVKVMVSCGYPFQGTGVAIVDPEKCELNPFGKVGEIWLSGPSIAQGYWNKPEETEKTFRAYTNDKKFGPFLRTGDLGFIHEGHLYITGRIKDLIIIRGSNHYPQDLEHTAETSDTAIQPGLVAAFSVDAENEERLVIVAEVKRTALRELNNEQVFESIRDSISQHHQLQAYSIVLIKPGTLPKTSSGKIQRLATKKEYLQNELEVISMWKAEISNSSVEQHPMTNDQRLTTIDSILDWIIAWMVKELKISRKSIDIDKPITAFGLDSLKAVVLARDAEDYFGIEWPLEMFLEETTIRKIAEQGMKILSGENSNN